MSIIVVLTSTGFRPSAGRNVFLTSFSLFRRAKACDSSHVLGSSGVCGGVRTEVCVCDRTPLRERLAEFELFIIQLDKMFHWPCRTASS